MRDTTDNMPLAICAGLPPDFIRKVEEACARSERVTLVAGHLESTAELEIALAAHLPDLVLLPVRWMHEQGFDLLARLEAASPHLRVLAIGPDMSAPALAQALPLGLRGQLVEATDVPTLARAMAAVLDGELCLSRRAVLEVVGTLSNAERTSSHSDTWRTLPALTEREHAVLQEVMAGHSNKEIARELDVSEQTVKVHLQHIYRKLGVKSRLDLLLARS